MIGGIEQLLADRVDMGRQNEQALMQSYAQNKQLIDLLALQKLKTEKEAAARQMQLQMQQQPQTIAQQREAEVMGMTRNEVAQNAGGAYQQEDQQRQQMMNKIANSGIASVPQGGMPKLAAGGIVSFQNGGDVLLQRAIEQVREALAKGMSPRQILQEFPNSDVIGQAVRAVMTESGPEQGPPTPYGQEFDGQSQAAPQQRPDSLDVTAQSQRVSGEMPQPPASVAADGGNDNPYINRVLYGEEDPDRTLESDVVAMLGLPVTGVKGIIDEAVVPAAREVGKFFKEGAQREFGIGRPPTSQIGSKLDALKAEDPDLFAQILKGQAPPPSVEESPPPPQAAMAPQATPPADDMNTKLRAAIMAQLDRDAQAEGTAARDAEYAYINPAEKQDAMRPYLEKMRAMEPSQRQQANERLIASLAAGAGRSTPGMTLGATARGGLGALAQQRAAANQRLKDQLGLETDIANVGLGARTEAVKGGRGVASDAEAALRQAISSGSNVVTSDITKQVADDAKMMNLVGILGDKINSALTGVEEQLKDDGEYQILTRLLQQAMTDGDEKKVTTVRDLMSQRREQAFGQVLQTIEGMSAAQKQALRNIGINAEGGGAGLTGGLDPNKFTLE